MSTPLVVVSLINKDHQLLLSTGSSHWILNHLHLARSGSNRSAEFADISSYHCRCPQLDIRVEITSVPYLSFSSTLLAVIIFASFTTAPSETAFFFVFLNRELRSSQWGFGCFLGAFHQSRGIKIAVCLKQPLNRELFLLVVRRPVGS